MSDDFEEKDDIPDDEEIASSEEDDVEVDCACGIPDSGIGMAIGYAAGHGCPYMRAISKYTPTWPRSFTPANQDMRELVAKMKLIPVQDLIEDKIKTLGTEHIYRIMLKGLVDSNLQLNLGNITQNYLINEIIDKTELDYDEAELYKNNADNLLGRLIEALSDENSIEDETIRSAAKRYGIEALLSSGE